jgi:hypothetical protein
MTNEEQIIQNFKACPRWDWCSTNICPLDPEVALRTKLPEEDSCPFTIKKKRKSQRGIKTFAPDSVLEVIPKSNSEMLNNKNLKRWQALHLLRK